MRKEGGNDAVAGSLEKILREAKRCKEILENLQSFSNRSAPERRPEDLREIVRHALEAGAAGLAEDRVEVSLEIDDGCTDVEVDRLEIQRALEQLFRNARKALRNRSGPRSLQVRVRPFDERVQIEVEDNGAGITPENLEKIFDPFYSTAEVGKGVGLGLSMVYGIVREHQGRILVTSQPGEGSTFTVDLPARDVKDVVTHPDGDRVPTRSVHPTVLVVDDEPVILDLLVDLLEGKGVRVETAPDGIQALEKISRQSFDAVVLDLRMPGMDGQEVYENLRQRAPEMIPRVLFATGDMVSRDTREFLDQAGAPCIQKPFRIEQVLDTLMGFLDGGAAAGQSGPAVPA
jgi:CheY-like chemotaxis protein